MPGPGKPDAMAQRAAAASETVTIAAGGAEWCARPAARGNDRHDQGGNPVGPPPSGRVVQDQGYQREQAGSRPDAAQGAVTLQSAAVHPPAQPAFGVRQRRQHHQRDAAAARVTADVPGRDPLASSAADWTRRTALITPRAMATTVAARASAAGDCTGRCRSARNRWPSGLAAVIRRTAGAAAAVTDLVLAWSVSFPCLSRACSRHSRTPSPGTCPPPPGRRSCGQPQVRPPGSPSVPVDRLSVVQPDLTLGARVRGPGRLDPAGGR